MQTKLIYLAGGCFWGAEHFFKQCAGIVSTETGFANGNTENPTYKEVYTDKTGFAEAVKIEYNPNRISLRRILEFFFMVIDPTSVNKQGEDVGTRYRTGIYYTDAGDLDIIKEVYDKEQSESESKFAVEVEPLKNYYAAEDYHQDYLERKADGYCHLPLKTFVYAKLFGQLESLLDGEPDIIARLSETAAMIAERMHFFWTGFYLVGDKIDNSGKELVLGPFQGPSACIRIAKGRGVCGSAWEWNRSVVVPDVEQFPGHIACSSLSRSEIVVPVDGKDGEFKGVLDLDSKELETFDETDRVWLEKICSLIYL